MLSGCDKCNNITSEVAISAGVAYCGYCGRKVIPKKYNCSCYTITSKDAKNFDIHYCVRCGRKF